jgi:hypothetical protein
MATPVDTKPIVVRVAGSDQTYPIRIVPGATPRDVFLSLQESFGLELPPGDFRLRSDRLSSYFGPDENIYPALAEGEELYANKSMDVARRSAP